MRLNRLTLGRLECQALLFTGSLKRLYFATPLWIRMKVSKMEKLPLTAVYMRFSSCILSLRVIDKLVIEDAREFSMIQSTPRMMKKLGISGQSVEREGEYTTFRQQQGRQFDGA